MEEVNSEGGSADLKSLSVSLGESLASYSALRDHFCLVILRSLSLSLSSLTLLSLALSLSLSLSLSLYVIPMYDYTIETKIFLEGWVG